MVDHLLHPITSVATLPFTPLKTNMTLENHPLKNRKYIFIQGGFSIVMLHSLKLT